MFDPSTINPYDPVSYKKEKIKVFQTGDTNRKDLVDYHFDFEITGDNLNRLLLFTTGYLGNSGKEDSYFVLDEDSIDKLIDKLQTAKTRLEKSRFAKEKLDECHALLEEYLSKGYVESITLEYRKNQLPPYYTPLLYKAFVVKPNFKDNIPTDVNKGFNFLEVLHLDINEGKFDEVMNHIRHYHNIPIHFVGYDHDKEIEKRKKQAMRELDEASKKGRVGMSESDRRKYSKMLEELNIPINVLASRGKNEKK